LSALNDAPCGFARKVCPRVLTPLGPVSEVSWRPGHHPAASTCYSRAPAMTKSSRSHFQDKPEKPYPDFRSFLRRHAAGPTAAIVKIPRKPEVAQEAFKVMVVNHVGDRRPRL